jgi:hypothetical protein
MKKIIVVLVLIIALILGAVMFAFFNTTCMFDGMSTGYYVERNTFEAEFKNFDVNISPDFSFSNNQLDLNTERKIYAFAKQNAIAYETHWCNGSAYYIKNGESFNEVSREKIHSFIDEKSNCNDKQFCSVLIGYAMANLVIKQE